MRVLQSFMVPPLRKKFWAPLLQEHPTMGAVGRCPAALSALIPGKMGAELNVRSVRHSRPRAFARANVCAPEADWEPFVRWQTLG